MTLPRIITEPLAGSPLAMAALQGRLAEWYGARPRNVDGWRAHLKHAGEPHRQGAWLGSLSEAIRADGRAAERLRRIVQRNGVVVSTGQQAALFGGPLYTLVKALSALAIADELERETGIATAVMFWAATDDADYDEASGTTISVVGGTRTLRLPAPPRAGLPMSVMPMPGVERLVAELEEACGSVVDARPLELIRRAFRGDSTLGNAYVALARGLLQPLGIAVLDASHPAVRRAAAPVLRRALQRAGDVESALRERYESVQAAGYKPQVEHVPELSLVFMDDAAGGKQRVPVREAARVQARTADTAFGPNVLLRPIVERFIMPSAAYVAGPGELAYFAQVSAVAAVLDVPAPLALPRWSMSLLEPRVERVLTRLGVQKDELRDAHALETRLARLALPSDIAEGLHALRQHLESDVAALEVLDRDELVPPASLQGLRRTMLHRLERLERRYAAAVKRRETQLMQDVATARGALYPEGKLQERVLNFIPFLTRYGEPLIEALHREAGRHAATVIGPEAAVTGGNAPVAERV